MHESEQKREWNGCAFDGRISGKKTSVDSTAKTDKKTASGGDDRRYDHRTGAVDVYVAACADQAFLDGSSGSFSSCPFWDRRWKRRNPYKRTGSKIVAATEAFNKEVNTGASSSAKTSVCKDTFCLFHSHVPFFGHLSSIIHNADQKFNENRRKEGKCIRKVSEMCRKVFLFTCIQTADSI